ncbi:hypothetical protein Ciccas_009026 [Cichlidogyrus casuarinus]|uniref:Ig-like domain-containing protein n=1 Tax=Cichlidogyrus casuarinus TaxID=1844966 RepID=A0ABD2PYX4_9PLAT
MFTTKDGESLNLGLLASQVAYDGPNLELELVKMLPPGPKYDAPEGRCRVWDKGIMYASPKFPVKVEPSVVVSNLPEGDGTVELVVSGLGPNKRVPVHEGDTKLECRAIDSRTKQPAQDVKYGWESRIRITGEKSERFGSSPNAILVQDEGGVLILKNLQQDQSSYAPVKMSSIRCYISQGSKRFTSPFYYLSTVDGIPEEKDKQPGDENVLVKILGSNEFGHLSTDPSDPESSTVSAECLTLDVRNGNLVQGADYKWDLLKLNGDPADLDSLGDAKVSLDGPKLKITNVKLNPGLIKIRCRASNISLVTDPKREFMSKSFLLVVPSNALSPEFTLPEDHKLPIEATSDDVRVNLLIEGLDKDGNLLGNTGKDITLKVKPELKEGFKDDVEIISYNWQFFKPDGSPASLGDLAEKIEFDPKTSELKLIGLKDTTDSGTITGRATVTVRISQIGEDGEPDTSKPKDVVKFKSPAFAVSLVPEGSYHYPDPNDLTNSKYKIKVHGLDEKGNLKAAPGDIIELRAVVVDTYYPDSPLKDLPIIWDIKRPNGRPLANDELARDIRQEGNKLVISYLRPIDPNDAITGKVKVFIPKAKRFYESEPFRIISTPPPIFPVDPIKPSQEGTQPKVTVKIDGLDKTGKLTATEGDTKELVCSAVDSESNEPIKSERVVFKWEFEDSTGRLDQSAFYGQLANKINHEPQGKLTLEQVKGKSWIRGRCEATVLEATDSPKSSYKFNSPYFYNGILSSSDSEPVVDPYKPFEIDGITHDPKIRVRVNGLSKENLLEYKNGDSSSLNCIAIG